MVNLHVRRNEFRHRSYTLHKNITDLKVKHKTSEVLEDNTGENLDGPGYGNDVLDTTPKAHTIYERKNWWAGLHQN